MDTPSYGPAIFSTHLGRFEARNTLSPSIILRSNPENDRDDMVAKLQSMFPEQCKVITSPVARIHDYFDLYDQHRHGYLFLGSVLGTIASHNFRRAQMIQGFVDQWRTDNMRLFSNGMPLNLGVFTDAEVRTYGWDFLKEGCSLLESLRINLPSRSRADRSIKPNRKPHANQAAPSASALGKQSGARNKRQNSQLTTPPAQPYAQGSSRQSSSSNVTLQPDSNIRLPVHQRPKYELLRQPGGINFPARRDFHSDPEHYTRHAQTLGAGPIFAIPPTGPPGPFFYQYIPPDHRVLSWPPKFSRPVTVQNPVKTVSDDARVLEMQEAAGQRVGVDSNNQEPPFGYPCGFVSNQKYPDSALHRSAYSTSTSSSPGFHRQPATYSLYGDPAVISVGYKTNHGLSQDHYPPADVGQHPQPEKEGSLTTLIETHRSPSEHPSTLVNSVTTQIDTLAESHVENAYATHQKYDSINAHDEREITPPLTQVKDGESHGYEQKPVLQNVSPHMQDSSASRSNSVHEPSEIAGISQSSLRLDDPQNQRGTSHSGERLAVWVGGLHPEISQAKVKQIFEPYGEVAKVSSVIAPKKKYDKPFAYTFVTFLNAQSAARAVNYLNFVDFEGMRLRVKYAHQAYNHGGVNHSLPFMETRIEKPEQRNAANWTTNSGLSQAKERNVIEASQGSRQGKPSKPSPPAKADFMSRSDRDRNEVSETPNPISRLISQHGHKQYLPAVQNENDATAPAEVTESTEHSTTSAQEVNVATNSSAIVESLGDSSMMNQEVNADVPEQREPAESEQAGIIVAGPLALDVGIKDPSRTLPHTLSRIDEIPATEPQANQDRDESSSSLVPVDTPATQPLDDSRIPTRLTHKGRWKLRQRATKAAKQKKNARKNEHLDSGAMSQRSDSPTPTTVESVVSCIEPTPKSTINPSVSGTHPRDTAEEHVKVESNGHLESPSIEKSSAAFAGLIEGGLQLPPATGSEAKVDMSQADSSGIPARHLDHLVASLSKEKASDVMQEQVHLTPKSVEAPEIISKSVDETLISELPSLSVQAKTGGAEGPPSPSAPITTHKKKKKKKQKALTSSTDNRERPGDAPPLEGSPATPEPHVGVTKNPTDNEVLPVRVDATHNTGCRDRIPKTMGDKEALDRINEPSTPPRGESATPTRDHPSSTAFQSTTMNNKKSRKSKRKQKTKSAKGLLQTSNAQSKESQGSSLSYVRTLPEPERPFLVGNVDIISPVKTEEAAGVPPSIPETRKKGYKNKAVPSNGEESSICSRREIKQYRRLRIDDYLPAMYKATREFSAPDPTLSMVPIPEESRDVEHVALSRSQSTPLGEAETSVSEQKSCKGKRISISETADDKFNPVLPDAIAQAESILQTCAKLTGPGSSTVAEPGNDICGNEFHCHVSVSGATDLPLSDSQAAAEIVVQPKTSVTHQPDSGSESPPKRILAPSDITLSVASPGSPTLIRDQGHSGIDKVLDKSVNKLVLANPSSGSSKKNSPSPPTSRSFAVSFDVSAHPDSQTDKSTVSNVKASSESMGVPRQSPPRQGWRLQGPRESNWYSRSRIRPQTPPNSNAHTITGSLSSLETLTDDESSESSSLQSGDGSIDQGGEEHAVNNAEDSSRPAPRKPVTTYYPCHPAAIPLQPKGPSTLQPGDVLEVAHDSDGNRNFMNIVQDWSITDVMGVARDVVERRDSRVVPPQQVWGYAERVWNN